MSVKRYDFDCYAFYDSARLDTQECDDGDYVLHSDYAAIRARHNALKEAVAWERETYRFWEFGRAYTLVANDEAMKTMFAARAEVDRILEEAK